MKSDAMFFLELAVFFLPFLLFVFLNARANLPRQIRCKQFAMPLVALIYGLVILVLREPLAEYYLEQFLSLAETLEYGSFPELGELFNGFYVKWGAYLALILFNTNALLQYVILKWALTRIFRNLNIQPDSFLGALSRLLYTYEDSDRNWYIQEHFTQARSFVKTIYYSGCAMAAVAFFVTCGLCVSYKMETPFSPVFAVILLGEIAFYLDGLSFLERKPDLKMESDSARHVAMYPLLRKPLKEIFGDKLSAEGTTVNTGGLSGGAIEDILVDLEKKCGHLGRNYAAFIRKKMAAGLKPNVDYVRSGYDLASGKSLLFNTPFYDKLDPYLFYAMNRELLTGGKILVVLGRHGTEEDLLQWTSEGMQGVSNIPELWKIAVLTGKKSKSDELPDIGIISRSGVHDLDIHKNNLPFLRQVSFVLVIEPSRLVTTAQIGLNLLIKCCGKEKPITFCSVDRNCDGLVDSLSHILMTNITEVNATEYPRGMSSYMYWTADDDYLQHRMIPGVSRYLGMGTELSTVALRNQVKKTVWYGGEAYPVLDARWIAKQYYHDLLDYAGLPTNQETFDKSFQTSFNLCNERVSDYSFITVEDDRNNLFETRRNFATIAEQQGFVNVISSEYMLREYMSDNTALFTADPKAIPYITADYARTKRNAILSLCLLLCIDMVKEAVLLRQMAMLNIDTRDPASEIWKEVCLIFGCEPLTDKYGTPILVARNREGKKVRFHKNSTILYKRAYSMDSGKFETVYTIEDAAFSRIILDDLQNASYIAEQESKDVYIGTELKGHVYQKYLPGQFFTLSGKYYEMVATATDNRILVRRAADHIGGRLAYRQIRDYTIHRLEDSDSMGELKTVNSIGIYYQYADFSVETPGYWKLHARNDFDNGALVKVNGVPTREYHHKQVLKFDFSKLGDAFTDSVRMTLTNLLNEVFVTLFADNQPFISAITPGDFGAPITYSLELDDTVENADKCIFIVEDSQLDIGLLIAVERNVDRIFQIIADYLGWNEEQIRKSKAGKPVGTTQRTVTPFDVYSTEGEPEEKKNLLEKLIAWILAALGKDKKKEAAAPQTPAPEPAPAPQPAPEPQSAEPAPEVPEEPAAEVTEVPEAEEPSEAPETVEEQSPDGEEQEGEVSENV